MAKAACSECLRPIHRPVGVHDAEPSPVLSVHSADKESWVCQSSQLALQGLQMARSRSTLSVRNGAENGQSSVERQKKGPPGWAASCFSQFPELPLRLQQNLVSRFRVRRTDARNE